MSTVVDIVKGKGRFVDDIVLPEMQHLAIVSGASADVSRDCLSDLIPCSFRILLEIPVCHHDHTCCTITALKAVFIQECLLKRMQFITF